MLFTYVFATWSYCRRHIICVQAGVEHSVDWCFFLRQPSPVRFGIRASERHGRLARNTWLLARLDRQGWERLEWQRRRARGKAGDEPSSKAVDGVEVEWRVKGLGEWLLLQGIADIG